MGQESRFSTLLRVPGIIGETDSALMRNSAMFPANTSSNSSKNLVRGLDATSTYEFGSTPWPFTVGMTHSYRLRNSEQGGQGGGMRCTQETIGSKDMASSPSSLSDLKLHCATPTRRSGAVIYSSA